ncbi:7068_t:CDS:2 [Acaulospora morrowiae]|uniref:7068_t:CDS:1 n=1 Tax=Acaulospora morrowiae TaxID=94023 RepID=A0A9N8YT58_9GLOM|nr:7068_t:CDS:2 [Acaulospora morrowiae]
MLFVTHIRLLSSSQSSETTNCNVLTYKSDKNLHNVTLIGMTGENENAYCDHLNLSSFCVPDKVNEVKKNKGGRGKGNAWTFVRTNMV